MPWAASVRRDLPWRRTRNPWWVLVSEVMLQQTQVSRVVPKWEVFIERFPTASACAEAPQADVVRLWEGLGYHQRAVMLHRCAQAIRDRHDGVVPPGIGALLALPGVGSYTARAIRVFAYETDDAVLDTNVGRILARAVAGSPCTGREAQAIADSLVPVREGWTWNQGMLDLGALVCTKQRPRCAECCIRSVCEWRRRDPDGAHDPATGSAGVSTAQSKFNGSDRQGRGRMLAELRGHRDAVSVIALGEATGWSDKARIARALSSLVMDQLAVVDAGMVRLR